MRKVTALVAVCMALAMLTACAQQEPSPISDEQFKRLAGNAYSAVGSTLKTCGLEFDVEDEISPEVMQIEGFWGMVCTVSLPIPTVLADDLPENTMTAVQPDYVRAIMAQAFKKADLKNKFIIVNSGRYFPSQLEDYVIYEDDVVIVYDYLPFLIKGEYEKYLNSQKPFADTPDSIRTYYHWADYVDDLKDISTHVKVIKARE